MLDTTGSDLVEKIDAKQAELAAALDQSAQSLNEALAAGASASVNSLVSMQQQVRAGMSEAIEALDAKNLAVQRTVESAQVSFVAVEVALAARIAEFEQATAGIGAQIDSLGANAGSTIASAELLYQVLAQQQLALAEAAADLSRFKRSLTARSTSAVRRSKVCWPRWRTGARNSTR